MRPGIQSFLAEAGEAACYALVIVEIAERENGGHIDLMRAVLDGIDRGYIRYNWTDRADPWNFFVDFPELFLSILTGKVWKVTKEAADYVKRPGEHVAQRWEWKKTGNELAHFRLPDWDSVTDSQTVRYGQIASTRVFRRAYT
jgi:hypothetical protein